ncbi:MAG: hypothetical protein IJ396_05600 [Oscillibacter sp.]|nr:hypothetical protein [Oscillibacter sp.]
MIKFEIGKQGGRFVHHMEVSGTVDEYTSELLACISELYAGIYKHNPGIAAVFRASVIAGVVAPGTPVWDGKMADGAEMLYAEHPGKR